MGLIKKKKGEVGIRFHLFRINNKFKFFKKILPESDTTGPT